jgi:hypothetical protein
LALNLALLEPPTTRTRLFFAALIGVVGALIVHSQYARGSNVHTDFGMVWFGARAIAHGLDPYSLIGPGRMFNYEWPLIYPATALVAVMPLAPFTEHFSAVIFVGLSSFLLALGITQKGWHLLPLFATEAYASSARLGQWSILLTSVLFFPWVALVLSAKPQAALPLLLGAASRRTILLAVAGGLALVIVSLVLLPNWPVRWLDGVRSASFMDPPITQFGGPLVLLALLRWKRPEAWMLVALACMPQAWGWYNTLPLFTIPATLVEALFLAAVSTLGAWIGGMMMPEVTSLPALHKWVTSLIVFTTYLPATLLLLRRPNSGLSFGVVAPQER